MLHAATLVSILASYIVPFGSILYVQYKVCPNNQPMAALLVILDHFRYSGSCYTTSNYGFILCARDCSQILHVHVRLFIHVHVVTGVMVHGISPWHPICSTLLLPSAIANVAATCLLLLGGLTALTFVLPRSIFSVSLSTSLSNYCTHHLRLNTWMFFVSLPKILQKHQSLSTTSYRQACNTDTCSF